MGIATVALVGNLTRNPELKTLPSGTSVCNMRVAVNDRRKVGEEWQEVPGYYDVVIFGKQAENASKYLEKGRQVAIAGKLQWREWETTDGQKRQAVEILANEVQFIGSRSDAPAEKSDDDPGW